MTNSRLSLSSESLELELAPSTGGSISGLSWVDGGEQTPVLRRSPARLERVLDAASFPLVPFANRIAGGCFTFRDRQIRLAPNMEGDPSPLHGQGWTSSWQVRSSTQTEAVLCFEHEPGEWPWAYEASQHLQLAGSALHLRLTCRNLSDEAMPCGLGFHPFFRCGRQTNIQTQVEEVWTVDDDVLPLDRVPATGRYSIFDDPVCGRDLDNGYGGWSGRALLTDPGWPFEIELSSGQARYFQLYSPAQGALIAAEPVTHANAALNEPEEQWASLGIRILEPGVEMALDARISVQRKQAPLG
ncbi:MAG TPA: aldose 1-epimerase [Sphingomicrobium sp.]|nr:aldose 1-epimerase [Sphingomicrobium sp.]